MVRNISAKVLCGEGGSETHTCCSAGKRQGRWERNNSEGALWSAKRNSAKGKSGKKRRVRDKKKKKKNRRSVQRLKNQTPSQARTPSLVKGPLGPS